mgnify:CR=1 FL=1
MGARSYWQLVKAVGSFSVRIALWGLKAPKA